jgi:hypothetical protein
MGLVAAAPLTALLALGAGAASAEGRSVSARRRTALASFEDRPGATLVIEAPGEPLGPRGFDPLDVMRVDGTLVLHRRFLKLLNAAGEIEVMGHESLTGGVAPHPLFAGVRHLQLKGPDSVPVVVRDGDAVVVHAPGIDARFDAASVEQTGPRARLRLEDEAER